MNIIYMSIYYINITYICIYIVKQESKNGFGGSNVCEDVLTGRTSGNRVRIILFCPLKPFLLHLILTYICNI